MFIYFLSQKLQLGGKLTVALVVSWQNKVGDRQRGDGRRKQRMNNLRVMPRDLSTSLCFASDMNSTESRRHDR